MFGTQGYLNRDYIWLGSLLCLTLLTQALVRTSLVVCSAAITAYADIATYALATKTGLTGSDFTAATGDAGAGSRKCTVAQQANISIAVSGTATHVAIHDGTDYIVTTCTSQVLTSGGTVTVPAWKREIGIVS